MDILLRIPDDLARRLGTPGEVERRALEALGFEEYRLGHLTAAELQRLLGFATARTLDVFLQEHVPDTAAADDAGPSGPYIPVIDDERRTRAREAVANIIARRKGVTLGGLNLKDLIDDGRP